MHLTSDLRIARFARSYLTRSQVNSGVRRLHTSRMGRMPHFVRAVDISPVRSWDLVRWCHARGADEFSWREMGIVGRADPVIEAANAALAAYQLLEQVRPTSVVYSGESDRRPVKLWRLESGSLEIVARLLPDGIFTEPTYSNEGWIEDPIFYRSGEVLLGVISHEDEAFLNLSPSEASDLKDLGFALYSAATYEYLYKQPSNER